MGGAAARLTGGFGAMPSPPPTCLRATLDGGQEDDGVGCSLFGRKNKGIYPLLTARVKNFAIRRRITLMEQKI